MSKSQLDLSINPSSLSLTWWTIHQTEKELRPPHQWDLKSNITRKKIFSKSTLMLLLFKNLIKLLRYFFVLSEGITRWKQCQVNQKSLLCCFNPFRIYCKRSFVFFTQCLWTYQHSPWCQEPSRINWSNWRRLVDFGASCWIKVSQGRNAKNRWSHWSW